MADLKEKLKSIIDERENRKSQAGGELFAILGSLNFIAGLLYEFVIESLWIWVAVIVLSVVVTVIYSEYTKRKYGKTVFGSKVMVELWIFTMLILPFLFYVFPAVFHFYSYNVAMIIAFTVLGIAVYISGIITTTISLRVGGVVFLIAATISGFKEVYWFVPYTIMSFGGLILPGIFSIVEAKRQK